MRVDGSVATHVDASVSEGQFVEIIVPQIKEIDNGIHIDDYLIDEIKPIELITEPYPGFPTDLQAQFMALLTQAQGVSVINEKIFENRFDLFLVNFFK